MISAGAVLVGTMVITYVGATAFVVDRRGCVFAAQPADCGLDAFAVLGRWIGGRVHGEAAWAALRDDVIGGGVFVGEVVVRWACSPCVRITVRWGVHQGSR